MIATNFDKKMSWNKTAKYFTGIIADRPLEAIKVPLGTGFTVGRQVRFFFFLISSQFGLKSLDFLVSEALMESPKTSLAVDSFDQISSFKSGEWRFVLRKKPVAAPEGTLQFSS